MVVRRTVSALQKARGWSQADLARKVGISRQAVSLWFRGHFANLQGKHLLKLSEAFGVPVESLARPLPCFGPETHSPLRATLLWDRLYPDLDDFAIAVNAGEPKALARLAQVYGLHAAAAMTGPIAWKAFPDYKRYIHPVRRKELELLWTFHESRTAA